MSYSSVIAIDGPSGSGKSTIAKEIGKKIGYTYIDTGAMFRSLGFYFHNLNILENQVDEIKSHLEKIDFQYGESENKLTIVNGVNLTQKIREHFVSDLASRYSKVQIIRDYLKVFQQNLAKKHSCVMEGRDIGTVIFPNAFLKVFLTASDEVRAHRRKNQLDEKGEIVNLEQILMDIKSRDERDSSRSNAPLKKADDAIEINTDHLTIDEVINKIIELEKLHRTRLN